MALKLKCIVIDDEPCAGQLIGDYVTRTEFLELAANFDDSIAALRHLNGSATEPEVIDLIFLDIQMPDLNGLELAACLKGSPMIVFTTASREHALVGFDLEALDYLLKPVTYPRFLKSAQKALAQFELQSRHHDGHEINPTGQGAITEHVPCEFIFVKVNGLMTKLAFKEIIYIEGDGDYVKIWLKSSRNHMVLANLTWFLEMLPHSSFMRIHRSIIVNLQEIETVGKNMVTIAGEALPIGKTYRAEFSLWLSKVSNVSAYGTD